jgi:alanine dehydrogenase
MKIGTVKELKKHEYRVGLTPRAAAAYIKHGHTVYIQKGAGEGSSYADADYKNVGCKVVENPKGVFSECDMMIKVNEPLTDEYELIHEGQILYTYLHLASNRQLTDALLRQKCIGIGFETITDAKGDLPCLIPMSRIAGRMAVTEGAKYLEKTFGGKGVLLSGAPGMPPANIVVLGAGTVGANAVKIAVGMGAHVIVLDINVNKLSSLDNTYGNRISTLYSTPENIDAILPQADLVIGAVLIPGAAAPKIIKNSHLRAMQNGAVIVDVAIDQGGCSEASRVTYHDDPIFIKDGVINYCVDNIPGVVANTATDALINSNLDYGLAIADKGVTDALKNDPCLMNGLNIYKGAVTFKAVAEAHRLKFVSPSSIP